MTNKQDAAKTSEQLQMEELVNNIFADIAILCQLRWTRKEIRQTVEILLANVYDEKIEHDVTINNSGYPTFPEDVNFDINGYIVGE